MKARLIEPFLTGTLALSLLGCGVPSDVDVGTDGKSQSEAAVLAAALQGGAGLAAAGLTLPVVFASASTAVVVGSLIVARADYEEQMKLAILGGLEQWRDGGYTANQNWYSIALQQFEAIQSDIVRADFAAHFAHSVSPVLIAQLSSPYDDAYHYAEVSLDDVSALHAAIVAHLARPEVMTAVARAALVPEFMHERDFAAYAPAITEMFAGFQAQGFDGRVAADLASWTTAQLTSVSAMLHSATGARSRTLQEQAVLSAHVHAAFFTGVFLAADTKVTHSFPETPDEMVEDAKRVGAAAEEAQSEGGAAAEKTIEHLQDVLDNLKARHTRGEYWRKHDDFSANRRASDALRAAQEAIDRAKRHLGMGTH